jgi:hypothetical protein
MLLNRSFITNYRTCKNSRFHKPKYITMPPICSTKSHQETLINRSPIIDNNEAVFYVYYIGYQNNELLYHYGVSTDLALIELKLHSYGINKYIKVYYEVLDHHVNAEENFSKTIKDLNMHRTLYINNQTINNVFTISNGYSFHYVKGILNDVFS